MRKLLLGIVVVLLIAAIYYRKHRHPAAAEYGYASGREVTLYDSTAQVRTPVTTVAYGTRLEILRRDGDQAQVRTANGATGWLGADELLSEDLWDRARELDAYTTSLPAEARGHTRVLSNLHLDPARDAARVQQLVKGVPVEIYERRAAPAPGMVPVSGKSSGGAEAATRKEDWWLVRARAAGEAPISGWILGRFLELDPPAPLPDYADAAGMRMVAWFTLDEASDPSGPKPQYLAAGSDMPEGGPCDFSTVRVYTWSRAHQRYETAYVKRAVCGKLPVKIEPAAAEGPGKMTERAGTSEVRFAFQDIGGGAPFEREFLMRQTIVREVDQAARSARLRRAAKPGGRGALAKPKP